MAASFGPWWLAYSARGQALCGKPRHRADRVLRVDADVRGKHRRVEDVKARQIVRFQVGPHHAAARVRADAGGAEQVGGDEVDQARIVGQAEDRLDLLGRADAVGQAV